MTANRKKPKSDFSQSLLKWFDHYGRKSLPWQQTRDPYYIWIAEIMLQQTQVETVISYYQKFIARFPNIDSLANAEAEAVMTYWAGLGYYARARNLHRAAQQIRDQHGGDFPLRLDQVMALPGIGRSTASAILAFSQNARHPILDGNVKRVLTRYFAIAGYPATKAVENQLWVLAEQLTPNKRVADYTQAIMDFGATLCSRRYPDCSKCPISHKCLAFLQGNPASYPTPKPKAPRPHRQSRMILISNSNSEYLLIKRPPSGIWGGLWVFPELSNAEQDFQRWCKKELGIAVKSGKNMAIVHHGFTHFELEIQPIHCTVDRAAPGFMGGFIGGIMDTDHYLWHNPLSNAPIAIPTAIKKIFNQLVE
ncbi:A/G-specific adenine glycosylase [Candidatus Spongiihabitans sp.]|uniref:A/G-specific adenine glycosylase n=1 Tax=Candidatus Spongiihabitans sp. TaxID=3101308 RepID=UPI003C6F0285